MADIRKLIVLCDGTWNEPEQLDGESPTPTNVEKFAATLASDSQRQVQHYEEGVGTREWEAAAGGVYGFGLEKRVLGAYRFLSKRFADRDWSRDEQQVFLFGFSRGAYTARRIAGLIAHSGVPQANRDCELGWEVYLQKDVATAEQRKADGRFFNVPIEMVGVWDTVKATNDADYHDTLLSPNVVAGYHAIAIDERRKSFPALRWEPGERVTEVWFAGVHSDVGGGYRDAGLSDIALRWMIGRAQKHGLIFKQKYFETHVAPNHLGTQHDSFQGIWVALGEEPRKIEAGDSIHASVKRRMEEVPGYRPGNLPAAPNFV